jgi:hypothetical protein
MDQRLFLGPHLGQVSPRHRGAAAPAHDFRNGLQNEGDQRHHRANQGGGVANESTLTVTNSTFFTNSASDEGGGIFNDTGATLSLANNTFSGNTATDSGGIYNHNVATSVAIANSILVNSGPGGNCAGIGVANGAYNLADDATCGFGSSTGANGQAIGDSVTDANIALSSLADNGGPTQTFALEAGSYAIDAVPLANLTNPDAPTPNCPATDQRGFPRPDGADRACDSGAFESGPTPPPATIGFIEVCYNCANNWPFINEFGVDPNVGILAEVPLGIQNGPAFIIENVTAHDILGASFTADSDSLLIAPIPANSYLVVVPGESDDLGSGHTFWNVRDGVIRDTSAVGPDANDTQFELDGTWNGQAIAPGLLPRGRLLGRRSTAPWR